MWAIQDCIERIPSYVNLSSCLISEFRIGGPRFISQFKCGYSEHWIQILDNGYPIFLKFLVFASLPTGTKQKFTEDRGEPFEGLID
jgi:hypothetical protein